MMLHLHLLLALGRERRKPSSWRIPLSVPLRVMEISGDRVF